MFIRAYLLHFLVDGEMLGPYCSSVDEPGIEAWVTRLRIDFITNNQTDGPARFKLVYGYTAIPEEPGFDREFKQYTLLI